MPAAERVLGSGAARDGDSNSAVKQDENKGDVWEASKKKRLEKKDN